jgi:hypothetical protein
MGNVIITREAVIDFNFTPAELLVRIGGSGRRLLIADLEALKCMPRPGREKEKAYFFPLKSWRSPKQLLSDYKKRKLVPASYAQGMINADDPAFADVYANVTCWQGDDGRYYFMICDLCHTVRYVTIGKAPSAFAPGLWVCGVPKL